MKILHVTFGLPPYASGGLPLYVEGLMLQQKKDGHEPIVLEPGPIFGLKKRIYLVERREGVPIYRIPNALPVSYNFGVSHPGRHMVRVRVKDIYEKFLIEQKPDVIHVHSIMGIHKEFFEDAKKMGIKIVMTTHDYYGLDLRANFVDPAGKVYSDRDPIKTAERNYHNGISLMKQIVMQTDFYKKIKNGTVISGMRRRQRSALTKNVTKKAITKRVVRQYKQLLDYYIKILKNVDRFLFNSTVSYSIYKSFLNDVDGEIIPLTLPGIKKSDKNYNDTIKKVGYIGRREKYKGVELLVEAAKRFPEIDFYLYGDDYVDLSGGNIYNSGFFNHSSLSKILNSLDLVVMPSIYYETFAFPVLESLSAGVPVLASSHVGAKDLLGGAPARMVFEPTTGALARCLERIRKGDNYRKICKWTASKDFGEGIKEHSKRVINAY